MKKLKLDLANLTVDSFDTTPATSGSRGTVLGQETMNGCTWTGTAPNGTTCLPWETCVGMTCVEGGCYPASDTGWCCSAACTVHENTCQGGMTGCGCASTVACGSQVTLDCGGCNDTYYENSCTDQGCTYCANAC